MKPTLFWASVTTVVCTGLPCLLFLHTGQGDREYALIFLVALAALLLPAPHLPGRLPSVLSGLPQVGNLHSRLLSAWLFYRLSSARPPEARLPLTNGKRRRWQRCSSCRRPFRRSPSPSLHVQRLNEQVQAYLHAVRCDPHASPAPFKNRYLLFTDEGFPPDSEAYGAHAPLAFTECPEEASNMPDSSRAEKEAASR